MRKFGLLLFSVAMGPGLALAQDAADTMPPSAPGMSGMRPMHGQLRHAAPSRSAHASPVGATPPVMDESQREYRGGAGSPSSTKAANTTAANTRSQMAPRLPEPDAQSNTPSAYLVAAQRALARGQTGAAQEALERAETRELSRSTVPSMAGTPDDKPMVQQIGMARRALASQDMAGANAAIAEALGHARANRAPELNPDGSPR